MGVDYESTVPGGSAHEVVAGVADDEAQIVQFGELDANLNVLPRLCQNDIVAHVSKGAALAGTRWECVARLVCPERPHVSHGMVGAVLMSDRGSACRLNTYIHC